MGTIWNDYYLKEFHFQPEVIRDNAERFAQMWEVTFFERSLRNGVPEMLERLKKAGYLLGIVSNNASFYAVSRDVVGPKLAGMARTIHIESGLTSVSDAVEHDQETPDYRISNIVQVADLLT